MADLIDKSLTVSAVRQALVDAAYTHGSTMMKASSAMFKAEIYATNAITALEPAEAGGKRAEEERDRRIEPEEVDRMLGASEPIMAEAYYGAEAAREAADARVAELEAALRFYADEETYETQYERLFCGCCTDIFEPINNDKGAIARATLAGKE